MGASFAIRASLLVLAAACAGYAPRAMAETSGADTPIFRDGFETGCAELAGLACDGGDTDLCATGAYTCTNDVLACTDDAASAQDLCNGFDDDCDVASSDGSEDPLIGGQCDGADTDMCLEGMQQCVTGAPVCSDATPGNVEICNGADDDCDGQTDEGLRNTNPACAGATDLGDVSGDDTSAPVQRSGFEEQWFRFRLTEDNAATVYLSATILLHSPLGVDFDLYAYCVSCGGTLAHSSAIAGLGGHTDTVRVRVDDEAFVEDDVVILVEVRYASGNACGDWSLTMQGNSPVNAATCP